MNYKMFEGYRVYEDGRVYSEKRSRWLREDVTRFGYLQYVLYINGHKYVIRAHQLVTRLFLDPPIDPSYIVVNHKDGNKSNNHYSNLEWSTYYLNNKHARDMGLNNVSESNRVRRRDDGFRKKVSSNRSRKMIERGSVRGERNGGFRYRATDSGGHVCSRQELATLIDKPIYVVDKYLEKAAHGESYEPFERLGITVLNTKQKGQLTIESISQKKDL